MKKSIKTEIIEGNDIMSEREQMYQLLDTVPDNKVSYIIAYIQELTAEERNIPNEETMQAMKEGDALLQNGTAQRFEGSTDDFFKMLLEDE